MAFFEDFGKRITQTGQEAVQKTKDFTETTRLNGQKNELEKQVESYYLEIGKRYYELHNTEPEEPFAKWVAAVHDAQEQISQLEEQIQQLKGTIRCLNCGAELQKGTMFCSACGTKVVEVTPQKEEIAGNICPNCGEIVSEDAAFCCNCGAKIVLQKVPEPKKTICSHCGSIVSDDALFCANCGTKI